MMGVASHLAWAAHSPGDWGSQKGDLALVQWLATVEVKVGRTSSAAVGRRGAAGRPLGLRESRWR